MKFLILLTLLFTVGANAQTVKKVLEFNNTWGTDSRQNYVKNPSARKSSQTNVTYSNFNASIGSGNIEGTNGFDLNATATSGYGEWTLNPFDDEDKVGNCQLSAYTKGTAANYKLQIVDGSGTELAFIQLRDTTDWTESTVVYPCGATGARKARFAYTSTGVGAVFNAGRITYKKYNDIAALDGASFFGSSIMGPGSGCSMGENSSSSVTNYVDLGLGTGCGAWTVSGKVAAVATNDHRIVLKAPTPAIYQVVMAGGAYNQANGTCWWRLSDGTNGYTAQQQYQSASLTVVPNLTFFVPVTTSGVDVTLKLQAADDQGTGCRLDVASNGMSWNVIRLPTGTAYSNVIPASLADAAFTWTGPVTLGGTTTAPTKGTTTVDRIGYALKGEGARVKLEYLQTTGGGSGAGDTLFTLPGGLRFDPNKVRFYNTVNGATLPNASGVALMGAWVSQASVSGNSMFPGSIIPYDATRFRVALVNVASGANGYSVGMLGANGLAGLSNTTLSISIDFYAEMEGRVPTANAMLFGGTVITKGPGVEYVQSAELGCGTSSVINIDRSSMVTSISNISSGNCTIVLNGFSGKPQCSLTPIDSGANSIKMRWISVVQAGNTTTMVSNCVYGPSDTLCGGHLVNLQCQGPR